jgi:hypothetical protein
VESYTIEGDYGDTNYRAQGLSGVIKLKYNQWVSVWIQSVSDNSWQAQSESGFSCHKLKSSVGFHAEKNGSQGMARDWKEIINWRTSGVDGLYNNYGKFITTARYQFAFTGPYYCYAQVRMDSATRSYYFRLILGMNNGKDINNGLHAMEGDGGSNNYRHMAVAGTLFFKKGNYVSMFMYTNGDNSWSLHGESGYGCHFLSTKEGFHADMSSTDWFGTGWHIVKHWRTTGNNELYKMGSGTASKTAYNVGKAGYYVCAAQVRIDSMSRSYYVRLIISINGDKDTNNGLHAMQGNRGSTNYRTLKVAGTIWLKQKDSVSVMVYTNGDNSWTLNHESGFSCHMISTFTCTKCPARSTGHSIEAGCKCVAGTKGAIIPSSKGRRYTGSCKLCGKNFGFSADMTTSLQSGRGWQEISEWRTSGTKYGEIYTVGGGFLPQYGRYVAPKNGYYLCSVNLRMDSATNSEFMRLVLAVNGTDQSCGAACEKTSGFNADLRSSIYMGSKNNQWRELTNYHLRGVAGLYESHGEFNDNSGRFYPKNSGNYLCSSNVRFDSFGGSYTRLLIGINGDKDNHNGMAVITGDGRSTNYYSQMISGNIYLKKGQYASVWIFASGDNSYYISGESGFSCHRLISKLGFRADMTKSMAMGTGWREIKGPWRTSGEAGLYSNPSFKHITGKVPGGTTKKTTPAKKSDKKAVAGTVAGKKTTGKKTTSPVGFNLVQGRYYAPRQGTYFCSANLRLNSANVKGNFRLTIRHNNQDDSHNGLYIMTGNYWSGNYGSLQLASTIYIKGFVSPWLYSSSDNSWTVDHESGFGCHFLSGKIGFHADQGTSRTYGRYWQHIREWRTSGNDELYASTPVSGNGNWRVPKTGYYFCSTAVRIDNYGGSYTRLVISVDGSTSTEQGLNTMNGNRGSTNNRFMTVAGTMRLNKDQTVAVKIYSSSDNSWQLRTESGFSCHMLGLARSREITNFEDRINNGMAVIEGDGGAHNYRTMGVSGVVRMYKGEHASVFLYSQNDNSWQVHSESGFSCHRLTLAVGFHADKKHDQTQGTNWGEIRNWLTSGYRALYASGGGFDASLGRYKVVASGFYFCYAQVRLDDAARNLKRLVLSRNGERDVNNGFHAIGGNYGSTNYRTMRIAGNAYIKKGESVSLYTYSSSDSYTAHSESGFGCHRLYSGFGFHADMSQDQSFGRGWRRVTYWRAGSNEFLYSSGGGFSADGYYYAPQDGYYICSATARFDSADTSRTFRLLITINDNRDVNNGLHTINGYGSSDYRPLTVAGSAYVKEGQRVAMWVYSDHDNSWRVQHESGFGCHLIETYAKC